MVPTVGGNSFRILPRNLVIIYTRVLSQSIIKKEKRKQPFAWYYFERVRKTDVWSDRCTPDYNHCTEWNKNEQTTVNWKLLSTEN